jgi:hypothetical protein
MKSLFLVLSLILAAAATRLVSADTSIDKEGTPKLFKLGSETYVVAFGQEISATPCALFGGKKPACDETADQRAAVDAQAACRKTGFRAAEPVAGSERKERHGGAGGAIAFTTTFLAKCSQSESPQ